MARPERCVISLGSVPREWPMGWPFPPIAMPPGWPRKQTDAVRNVEMVLDHGDVMIKALHADLPLDQCELDSALDREMVKVTATDANGQVRVRLLHGTRWYDSAFVVNINGMVLTRSLAFERPCTVKATLFGYEPEKSITWEQA